MEVIIAFWITLALAIYETLVIIIKILRGLTGSNDNYNLTIDGIIFALSWSAVITFLIN
jgi:hypothetical protein